MAYKDEYEVARLHADTGFREKVAAQFEGDFKIHYHLAPPLLAKRNDKGELVKRKFGPSTFHLFKLLARLKGLRGTPLDLFGRTEERRTERALIEEYRQTCWTWSPACSPATTRWPWKSPACRRRSAATATSRRATWRRSGPEWERLMAAVARPGRRSAGRPDPPPALPGGGAGHTIHVPPAGEAGSVLAASAGVPFP